MKKIKQPAEPSITSSGIIPLSSSSASLFFLSISVSLDSVAEAAAPVLVLGVAATLLCSRSCYKGKNEYFTDILQKISNFTVHYTSEPCIIQANQTHLYTVYMRISTSMRYVI